MATAEVKELLHDKNKNIYVLTPEEEQMIDEAEEELDVGLGIPAEEIHKEMREWLHNKNEDIYILTPEEEQMIDEAEAEPCISDEEARRRTRECLNKLAQNFV
ncbi:MAG: hypothetical protein LBC02_13820 [Planctomycetaceae bacterium]|nr:hypothetical protein [Planctomycetaceae bacterium]